MCDKFVMYIVTVGTPAIKFAVDWAVLGEDQQTVGIIVIFGIDDHCARYCKRDESRE